MEIDKEKDEMPEFESRMERLSYGNRGKFFKLRNVLNTIFIILCLAGMASYYMVSKEVGSVALVAAVMVKMAECMMRFLN